VLSEIWDGLRDDRMWERRRPDRVAGPPDTALRRYGMASRLPALSFSPPKIAATSPLASFPKPPPTHDFATRPTRRSRALRATSRRWRCTLAKA
jgi:hypothetical protein